ncbi:response regulator [Geothrix sp. 21YS21S-4]|uniref:response regulator n=1 Tax=Geothrix sp. 21YS21S-4 TaxID=3068889 RepID=UPI0027B9AC70|nr:response regulator [Geothrix sp. 21YS21S-4]
MSPRPIVPPHVPSPSLLLVDDDPVPRETLSTLLMGEGFNVVTAATGEEAERLLRSAKPPFDLVITDLVMPGKSGMDVLRVALNTNPSCTVLLLTGFGSVREATEAMELGAFDFVTKPMQIDQFRNTLRRLMERRALAHERDELREKVRVLTERAERLETTLGRMEILANRITPTEAAAEKPDPLADLERLAALKAKGLLSDEEFEQGKRNLLSRWLA